MECDELRELRLSLLQRLLTLLQDFCQCFEVLAQGLLPCRRGAGKPAQMARNNTTMQFRLAFNTLLQEEMECKAATSDAKARPFSLQPAPVTLVRL